MEVDDKMDDSSKLPLTSEPPPDYTESPKAPDLPSRMLLIMAMLIVGMVLAVSTLLLAGLHITGKHTEAVLQMTIQGLDGKGPSQQLAMSRKERLAIFPIHMKINSSATVVYDYSNLVIGYRSWPGKSCYVIRMNQKDIQSLDVVTEIFQHVQEPPALQALGQREKPVGDDLPAVLADRSRLGAALNLLCSTLPVSWA